MINVRDLVKTYRHERGETEALKGISFDVQQNQFFTMLGPSGCGKTTALRCIAGLERPDRGEIQIADRIVVSSDRRIFVGPSDRNVGMVFQSYAIWPHMSVGENVAFPLRHGKRRYKRRQIREKVREVLEIVQLQGLEDRPAPLLSGGQQQRVALARALVMEPQVLLLDEPLSNLDARVREEVRAELREIQRRLKITVIYVTHDQSEALAISDVVSVMNRGSIVELGDPRSLYEDPQQSFTAQFIGVTNMVPGRITANDNGLCRIETEHGLLQSYASSELAAGTNVIVAIRPEDIQLTPRPQVGSWEGTIMQTIFLGQQVEYRVEASRMVLRVQCDAEEDYAEGDRVFLNFNPERCLAILE